MLRRLQRQGTEDEANNGSYSLESGEPRTHENVGKWPAMLAVTSWRGIIFYLLGKSI